MRCVPLSPRLPYRDPVSESTEAARLLAEISERFLELRDLIGEPKAQQLIFRLSDMARDPDGVRSIWYFFRLATGDLAAVSESLSESGKEMARSKQGEQKEFLKVLAVIARYLPETAEAIRQMKFKR